MSAYKNPVTHRGGESTETSHPKSYGTAHGSKQRDWVAVVGWLGRSGGEGGSLFATQQQLRVIEKAGFDFFFAAQRLEFCPPFFRSSLIAPRPRGTVQKERKGPV